VRERAWRARDSKHTTLPIARATIQIYVTEPVKAPWCIDLLNVNLNDFDREEATRRTPVRPKQVICNLLDSDDQLAGLFE
jgi:hypothetical protein